MYLCFRVHENIGYGIFVQGLNGVSNSFLNFVLALLVDYL